MGCSSLAISEPGCEEAEQRHDLRCTVRLAYLPDVKCSLTHPRRHAAQGAERRRKRMWEYVAFVVTLHDAPCPQQKELGVCEEYILRDVAQ